MNTDSGDNLTHYQTTNFRLFQTEEFADDNFKFNENCRKLSKRVESTVGKGEIARYEQYLLFPQCFQKACFPGASKGGNGLSASPGQLSGEHVGLMTWWNLVSTITRLRRTFFPVYFRLSPLL